MAGMRQTPLTCSGHTRPVVDLAFSDITPYGYFLISACKDGKPMLRQGDTGDWIGTLEGHKGAVWGATLNKDATRAATGAADFTAKVWDAVSGEELHTFIHKHIVKTVDFSANSVQLVTGSNDKHVRIYDVNAPESEPTMLSGHTGAIRSTVWTRDGKKIFTAADDKTVRLWDITSASVVKTLDFPSNPSSLELTRDGQLLIITCANTVTFWDTESLEKQKEISVPCPVYSASLHPERSTVVCGGEDFKMYKYDYATGLEIESFKGHFGPVHCIRFSPDGELYASGSEDGTLRLWQTTVGSTYGLWKCVFPEENNTDSQIVNMKAEA